MKKIDSQKPILIVAGEDSGDLLGGDLMEEMKENIDSKISFFGLGGKHMSKNDFKSLEPINHLSVMGITEALIKYRALKKIFNKLIFLSDKNNCELAILIDYPGFNLRLAAELQKRNIKVIFYVSPQIWAWKFKRIYSIQKNIDLMIVFFDFEKEIYDKYKIPCVQIAHPVSKRVKFQIENPTKKLETQKNVIYITLMPGSRSSEISKLLIILLKSAVSIQKDCQEKGKKVEFFLPNINPKSTQFIKEKLYKYQKKHPNLKIHYFFNHSIECINQSDIVILASGTASLEVTMLEKPIIIIYRVHFLTYLFFSFLTKVPYFSLVNLIAQREICKELIQTECTAKNIFEETKNLIFNKNYYNNMKANIQKVKQNLRQEKTNRKLALLIQEMFF